MRSDHGAEDAERKHLLDAVAVTVARMLPARRTPFFEVAVTFGALPMTPIYPRLLCLALLLSACGTPAAPPSSTPPGTSTVAPPRDVPPPSPRLEASDTGPCESAHDCVLRDYCGCSCDAVLRTVASQQAACEETCGRESACVGYTVICDLQQHRCGAIPTPPPVGSPGPS